MTDTGRERYEKLRRLLLAFVAMLRESDPDGQFTLDIRIVNRDRARERIAS